MSSSFSSRLAFARRAGVALLSFAALAVAGCGYALVGRGSTLPPEVKRVYLKPLENQTTRVQVDQILTPTRRQAPSTPPTFHR